MTKNREKLVSLRQSKNECFEKERWIKSCERMYKKYTAKLAKSKLLMYKIS